jgi:hypothetical protein
LIPFLGVDHAEDVFRLRPNTIVSKENRLGNTPGRPGLSIPQLQPSLVQQQLAFPPLANLLGSLNGLPHHLLDPIIDWRHDLFGLCRQDRVGCPLLNHKRITLLLQPGDLVLDPLGIEAEADRQLMGQAQVLFRLPELGPVAGTTGDGIRGSLREAVNFLLAQTQLSIFCWHRPISWTIAISGLSSSGRKVAPRAWHSRAFFRASTRSPCACKARASLSSFVAFCLDKF